MARSSDIPGLKRLPKPNGYSTWYWTASQISRVAGEFRPKNVRLWHGLGEPTEAEFAEIRARASRLTVDLRDWRLRQERRVPIPKVRKAGFVYFIRAGERVKIGFSQDVRRRVSQLQTFFPEDLELLHVEPGSPMLEHALHRKFAALEIKREWFRLEAPIVAYVAREQGRTRSEPVFSESPGPIRIADGGR